MQKGRIKGLAFNGDQVEFGSYAIKALESSRITARQIEAARRAMNRHIKRDGKIWIRIFPDTPISKKPLEVRMGKGKGNVEFWAFRAKAGKILFEMDGVEEKLAREAFELAIAKLPIKCSVIKKRFTRASKMN